MHTVVLVILVLALLGVAVALRPLLSRELNAILADLDKMVARLEQFKADKEVEIAQHLEDIAVHSNHARLKGAEVERAKRIRDRLTELLG